MNQKQDVPNLPKKQPLVKPKHLMYRTEIVDEKGRVIIQHLACVGHTLAPGTVQFMGKGEVAVPTPSGPRPVQIEFPIEASNINDAFMRMDQAARDHVAEMKKLARENSPRIHLPD